MSIELSENLVDTQPHSVEIASEESRLSEYESSTNLDEVPCENKIGFTVLCGSCPLVKLFGDCPKEIQDREFEPPLIDSLDASDAFFAPLGEELKDILAVDSPLAELSTILSQAQLNNAETLPVLKKVPLKQTEENDIQEPIVQAVPSRVEEKVEIRSFRELLFDDSVSIVVAPLFQSSSRGKLVHRHPASTPSSALSSAPSHSFAPLPPTPILPLDIRPVAPEPQVLELQSIVFESSAPREEIMITKLEATPFIPLVESSEGVAVDLSPLPPLSFILPIDSHTSQTIARPTLIKPISCPGLIPIAVEVIIPKSKAVEAMTSKPKVKPSGFVESVGRVEPVELFEPGEPDKPIMLAAPEPLREGSSKIAQSVASVSPADDVLPLITEPLSTELVEPLSRNGVLAETIIEYAGNDGASLYCVDTPEILGQPLSSGVMTAQVSPLSILLGSAALLKLVFVDHFSNR